MSLRFKEDADKGPGQRPARERTDPPSVRFRGEAPQPWAPCPSGRTPARGAPRRPQGEHALGLLFFSPAEMHRCTSANLGNVTAGKNAFWKPHSQAVGEALCTPNYAAITESLRILQPATKRPRKEGWEPQILGWGLTECHEADTR